MSKRTESATHGTALADVEPQVTQAVDEKKGWDKQVSESLKKKWNKWVRNLKTVKVTRSIAPYFEDIIQVSLFHFMDASDKVVSAQTVVVVTQSSAVT